MPIEQALESAENENLDLVEVSPAAKPPVCKIMNFGKYKYEISKKTKQAKKGRHVSHVKEIKMRSEISGHDYDFKIRHAMEFFQRGNKVKFTIVFRGREILHKENGEELLKRIIEDLTEHAVIESSMRSEGKNLTIIMSAK